MFGTDNHPIFLPYNPRSLLSPKHVSRIFQSLLMAYLCSRDCFKHKITIIRYRTEYSIDSHRASIPKTFEETPVGGYQTKKEQVTALS